MTSSDNKALPTDDHGFKKPWHSGVPGPSNIAQQVVTAVLQRDAHGQRKYGVTLDRGDLSTSDWLQHMFEELLDGAHYALAAKREIRREMQTIVTEAHEELMAMPGNILAEYASAYSDGADALLEAILSKLQQP